jgi:hypothetical protein
MFIVDPYSVYDCSSKEEGSEFFVKLQKELSLQTAAWLINVDITVIKEEWVYKMKALGYTILIVSLIKPLGKDMLDR